MQARDRALRRLTTDEALCSLEELAAATGIGLELLEVLMRENLLVPRVASPHPLFLAEDAEAVRAGLDLIAAGLPLGELLELARRANASLSELAEASVDAFARFVGDAVEGNADSEEEAEARLIEALERMLPAAGRLVAHHFQRLLLDRARRRLDT
jgi:hypothetical protein